MNPSPDHLDLIRIEAEQCAHMAQTAGQLRWVNAAHSAKRNLLESKQWAFDGTTLAVRSATDATIYRVSVDQCQCMAFAKQHACWHRAAYRIIKRASAYAEWLRTEAMDSPKDIRHVA